MKEKFKKNPTGAVKTDYNTIWSSTGQFVSDGGIAAVGA